MQSWDAITFDISSIEVTGDSKTDASP